MNIIIIEDEKPAARLLKRKLEKLGFSIKTLLHSVEESINWFENNVPPDLIFLDIQLSDGLSFEIFDKVEVKSPIIFTTAYDEYALRAFKLNSVDYLLKPYSNERFLKAIQKTKEYIEFLSAQDLQYNSIFVKCNNEMVKINLKNIEYIEALDDYIKIYIKPYPVLTLMTLKGVMEKLPAQLFARVHRSYIVPLNRIEKFSRNKIQIAGKEIPIGSSYADVYEKLLEINKH